MIKIKVFGLYHNKEKAELVIQPFQRYKKINEDQVVYWNENYFISSDRKLLRDKAKEIQEKWIKETEEYLHKIKEMKVKNKY